MECYSEPPWTHLSLEQQPLKRLSVSGARGLGSDVTHPWVLVTTRVLLIWVNAARRRSACTTVRGQWVAKEDSRRVEHRRILRRHHSDRSVGEDSKECEHCACVMTQKSSVSLHPCQVVFYREKGTDNSARTPPCWIFKIVQGRTWKARYSRVITPQA